MLKTFSLRVLAVFLGAIFQGMATLFLWPMILPLSLVDTQLILTVVTLGIFFVCVIISKWIPVGMFFVGIAIVACANTLGLLTDQPVMDLGHQIAGSLAGTYAVAFLMAWASYMDTIDSKS